MRAPVHSPSLLAAATNKMQATMMPRPFTAAVAAPASGARRACVAAATRRVTSQSRRSAPALRTRSAEPAAEQAAPEVEFVEEDQGRRRGSGEEQQPQFKHFLPLPKPAHLIYIKPTVAVVAGMAPRSSVGVKMTAGDNALERYVVEYYARSVK